MEAILDRTLDALSAGGPVGEAMTGLAIELETRRTALTAGEWREWVNRSARSHPLSNALRGDPFIRHSATRPRGYPGDAELLDFIYRSDNVRPRVESAST